LIKKSCLRPFQRGYIGTATSEGMKWRMVVFKDIR